MPIVTRWGQTFWMPDLFPLQEESFFCNKRYQLYHGPRLSGKTRLSLHKVTKHCWDFEASVGFFTRTTKTSLEGGAWQLWIDKILPEWFASGIGIEYWKGGKPREIIGPRVSGTTRTVICKLRNRHGTASTIYLNSLDHDKDAEDKLKEREFTCIYFAELSKFRSRGVFDAAVPSMRCDHIKYEDHLYVSDCNPADDGEDSWIYKLFIEPPSDENPKSEELQSQIHSVLFPIEANTKVSAEQKRNIISLYAHDPDLYARYVEGKWVRASTGAFFANVFRDTHVIGNTSSPSRDEWEVALPDVDCSELIIGFDPGDMHPCVVFIEKRKVDDHIVYTILDELYADDEAIDLREVVNAMERIIRRWEEYLERPLQVRMWADSSSEQFRSAAGAVEVLLIKSQFAALGRKVVIASAEKGKGSVEDRANITKRLLFENRLFVSASCFACREMFKSIKRSKSLIRFFDQNDFKHKIDAVSYVLASEEPMNIIRSTRELTNVGRTTARVCAIG